MQTYYVIPPFEIIPETELNERSEELRRSNRKIMAVIFDCNSEEEASRKYFDSLEKNNNPYRVIW